MQRLTKIGSEKDINLSGVDISLQVVDKKIEAVVVQDLNGNFVRIVKSSAYGEELLIYIQEPLEEVDHVYVVGSALDVEVNKSFGVDTPENRGEANAYVLRLLLQLNYVLESPPVWVETKSVKVSNQEIK